MKKKTSRKWERTKLLESIACMNATQEEFAEMIGYDSPSSITEAKKRNRVSKKMKGAIREVLGEKVYKRIWLN